MANKTLSAFEGFVMGTIGESRWLRGLEHSNLPSLIDPIIELYNDACGFLAASRRSILNTSLIQFQRRPSTLALISCVVVSWYVLVLGWKITYNTFFSPLRNIPGPFLAKITTKWLTINEVMGNRSLVVEQAHAKYGPAVRLAPNELSFSDRACIKELYLSGSKFPKSRRYEAFASTTRASFDMTDKDQHRERRNLVRHVLAQSNIDEAEPIIADQVRKSLWWVKRSEGGSLEVKLWMRRIMMDTAGALFLGREFGALENEEPPKFLDDMDAFFNLTALRWFAPWMVRVLKNEATITGDNPLTSTSSSTDDIPAVSTC
ncbi:MAG: hypothetical protein Q9217_002782 [Psora testacea]